MNFSRKQSFIKTFFLPALQPSVVTVAPTQKRSRDSSEPVDSETENKKARVAPTETGATLQAPTPSAAAVPEVQMDDEEVVILVRQTILVFLLLKNCIVEAA